MYNLPEISSYTSSTASSSSVCPYINIFFLRCLIYSLNSHVGYAFIGWTLPWSMSDDWIYQSMDSPFSRLNNLSTTHTFTFGMLNDLLPSLLAFLMCPRAWWIWKCFVEYLCFVPLFACSLVSSRAWRAASINFLFLFPPWICRCISAGSWRILAAWSMECISLLRDDVPQGITYF